MTPTDSGSGPTAAPRHPPPPADGPPISSAAADVVQPQPAPGTCHASGHGLYALPDPLCTSGALNPAVTQATVGRTICVSGYTNTIRPSEAVTGAEKRASMAAYGDGGAMSGYEYDHLVSLELGRNGHGPGHGALQRTRNLFGPLPRLGRVCPLRPARDDRDRHRRVRAQQVLAHRRLGSADVYVKAPASAAGETITVRVGAVTCQTSL